MVSLQRLSLTLDKMGEANESIISYEDLLSTALGESGLDLDDLFGNVPGNVLSQATLNDNRELKHATFLSHERQPEVNILQARTSVSSIFSKYSSLLAQRDLKM